MEAEKPVTAPDQIAISAMLERGVIASVFYGSDTSRNDNLHWEINGTKRDLVITSLPGNLQVAPLTLAGAIEKANETGMAQRPE